LKRAPSLNVLVGLLATAGSLAVFGLLHLIPSQTLATWAVRMYSDDGLLTAEGARILSAAVATARSASLVLVPAGLVLTWVIWLAEGRAGDLEARPPTPTDRSFASVWAENRFALLLLMGLGLAAALFHLTDSFYNDELDTIVLVAPRLSTIFGVGVAAAQDVPGNHILMSLLTHVMLTLGFRAEPALRIWSLAAFVGTIPVAFWLARLLDAPRWQATTAAALVATSPSLLLVGVAVRGYALTAFCGTAALACHLQWMRDPRRHSSLACAGFMATGLVANILTLPLSVAVAANTLYLPFDRRGMRYWRSAASYAQHLTAIFAAIAAGVMSYAFLLPHLVYGSVVYEGLSHRQWTPVALMKLLGDPLLLGNSHAGPLAGGCVVVALALALSRFRRQFAMEKSGTLALVMVITVGLAAYTVSGQTATRVSFYLAPSILVLLALELFDLHGWPVPIARPSTAIAVGMLLAAAGASVSVRRPATGRLRELAQGCLRGSGGSSIWTSTSDAKSLAFLQYYLPVLHEARLEEGLPSQASYYLKFDDRAHADDPTLAVVKGRCQVIARFGRELEESEALYQCPPLRDP
jgi:hypothetical protein